jgi:3-phenylpropionate/cinnamic acid dioxygenase small subunit
MSNSAVEITNLLYRYAELMDAGDLEAVAGIFEHAKIKMSGVEGPVGAAELLDTWRRWVKIYPCGTPRTKHVITNPIVEVDEAAGQATCRSYYTVLQQADDSPLQVVGAGRYHDAFERVEGRWRFAYRDYSLFDLKGDLSRHLDVTLAGALA